MSSGERDTFRMKRLLSVRETLCCGQLMVLQISRWFRACPPRGLLPWPFSITALKNMDAALLGTSLAFLLRGDSEETPAKQDGNTGDLFCHDGDGSRM